MKYLTSIPRAALSRAALLFCTALILSTTVGCGNSSASWNPFASEEPGWKDRTDYLEAKVDRIHLQMERHRDQSKRTEFWQATAALFIVLTCFALVGGAALGSRARRDRERFHQSSTPEGQVTDNPEEFTA